MNILEALTKYINSNFNISKFGLKEIQYEEMAGSFLPRCGIYSNGGGIRDVYIDGAKEVDFSFRIVYHCSSEDTNSRIIANNFFAELSDWFDTKTAEGLEGLELGTGNKPIAIKSSLSSKSETKQDNSQVWTGVFSLTYEQGGL